MLLCVPFLLEILKKFIAFLFKYGCLTMVQPISWYRQGYRYGLSYQPILITDTDKHFPYRQNRYISRYQYYRPIPIPIMISVAPCIGPKHLCLCKKITCKPLSWYWHSRKGIYAIRLLAEICLKVSLLMILWCCPKNWTLIWLLLFSFGITDRTRTSL